MSSLPKTGRAIRITPSTLTLIAQENGGLEPAIEDVPTYFILPEDPNAYAQIVTEEEFRAAARFTGAERFDAFNEFTEL